MDKIIQFYDEMADYYHLIFQDWDISIQRQASILNHMFEKLNITRNDTILDCACGIGTQALGLANLGYNITGSDISEGEIERAKKEAAKRNLCIDYFAADFCNLSAVFQKKFDVIIAMDNALPHLTEPKQLKQAASSIYARLNTGGTFIASVRDYDSILSDKPHSPEPYILNLPNGRRVAFQIWDWDDGDIYHLTQYIIEDGDDLQIHKFASVYRAITKAELTGVFNDAGFRNIQWLMPEQSGFYQPIMIAQYGDDDDGELFGGTSIH